MARKHNTVVLDFDDQQRKALDEIFNQTYERLTEASKEGKITDHDAIISSTLSFIERVIPKILSCYKGEAHESKRKGIAASLRIVIWSIMPFDKFMEYMNTKEMGLLDLIVKDYQDKGEVDIEKDDLQGLFKDGATAKDIYH